jgi:hypothetical protein
VNESLETWTARYHRKEAEGINLHRPLPIAVMQEQVKAQDFPTPRTCDWKSSPNANSNIKRMEVGQATLANWPTPNCMDVITPTRDLTQMESKGHWGKSMNTGKLSEMVNYGPAAPDNPSTDGSRQGSWATPRAEMDSGAHNGKPDTLHSQIKVTTTTGKLNPRWVETLMGLPVGWTMPSCASPVTIEPMSCAYSETASSRPPQNAPSAS